jgi:hypothetical protein
VINDLKMSLMSDGPISSYWAARAETEYRSVARSIFGGVPGGEAYGLITSCGGGVDFLKLSKSDPVIELVYNSYRGRARV